MNRQLEDFCTHFGLELGVDNVHNSELLARAFRKYFKLPSILRLNDLQELGIKIGILDIRPVALPSGSRGLYSRINGDIIIGYRKDDWDGSQEFTIPHEFREIIGSVMKGLFPSFEESAGEILENEADSFAAALLMDSKAFREDTISSGLDPIFLHEKYHKSYIAVVSRMAQVLNNDAYSPFWGMVFERKENTPHGFLLSGCFHRAIPYIPKARYEIPNLIFPKRGQLVPLSGSLRKAVEQNEAVYIHRLVGLDFWDRYCLSALIRPVIWKNNVMKLVVIAIPFEHNYKITPQLNNVCPLIVKEVFQFLWGKS